MNITENITFNVALGDSKTRTYGRTQSLQLQQLPENSFEIVRIDLYVAQMWPFRPEEKK